MEKGYLLLLFVSIALIIAMALTVLWGRGSKHGYGAAPGEQQQTLHLAERAVPLQSSPASPPPS